MEPSPPLIQTGKLEAERNALAQERTKLAAERTFLAWIRTGLTSIGIGIAIARFIIFRQITHEHLGHLIGQLLILWGVGIFGFALLSYRRSSRQFKSATTGGPFIGLTIATMVLIILCLLLFWIVVE